MRPLARVGGAFVVGVTGTWLVSSITGPSHPAAAPPTSEVLATSTPATVANATTPSAVPITAAISTWAPARPDPVGAPAPPLAGPATSATMYGAGTAPTSTELVTATIPTAVAVTFPEQVSVPRATTRHAGTSPDATTESDQATPEHHEHDHAQLDEAGVAAAFAVSLWSWRFDDSEGRLIRTVGHLADPDVLAQLSPTPEELERRRQVREVSWAIVVGQDTTDGEHHLELAQHAYSDSLPETTTVRHVVVAVTAGRVTAATIVDPPAS